MATFRLNTNQSYIDRFDIMKFNAPVNSKFSYFDIIDSEFLRKLKSLKKYKTYKVTVEEGRPELVSERIYGVGQTQFWWILMVLNELRLPKDLKRGLVLRYPTREELEDIYLSLNNDTNSSNKPRLNDISKVVDIERL
nr:MAG TPA: baseplate wedge protein [Caudoviricetes sp.]